MPDEVELPPLRDITQLVWPFPSDVIKKNPSGGGDYVPHPIVEQRLIFVLGRPPTTELVEVVRGTVLEKPPDPKGKSARAKKGSPQLDDAVVGVILRMTVVIDGERVEVTEVGDCEDPHNWTTDGARLKDAFSDAYKRCAMRLGVGLHLWTKEAPKHYTIHKRFIALDRPDDEADVPEVPDTVPIDTTAHEADDSGPEAPSEPSTPPEVPPAKEEASEPPQPREVVGEIDWPKLAKSLGITQATAITEARALADELIEAGVLPAEAKPGSLQHIDAALAAPLHARFTDLAQRPK